MSHSIYLDLKIKAESSKIFTAITDATHLVNWWPLKCSGNPSIEAEYNFNFTNDYDWYGIVEAAVQDKLFIVKMTKSDIDWNGTRFGFELEPNDENTIVKFTHSGWPHNNHHYRFSAYCWAQLLKALKDYIEKGTIIPFDKRS